jgi:hypothetical protein
MSSAAGELKCRIAAVLMRGRYGIFGAHPLPIQHARSAKVRRSGLVDETLYRSERDDWILEMVPASVGYTFMPEQCTKDLEVVLRPLSKGKSGVR